MTMVDDISDEKLQFDINWVALSSGKINKCEYLTGKEILPQARVG